MGGILKRLDDSGVSRARRVDIDSFVWSGSSLWVFLTFLFSLQGILALRGIPTLVVAIIDPLASNQSQ